MTQTCDTMPGNARIMAAIDVTWPSLEKVTRDRWVLRRGAGGGKRVSAASGTGDIAAAEAGMRAWQQAPMFSLMPEDNGLDADLDAAGYRRVDPTLLYAGHSADLTGDRRHQGLAYLADCRPALLDEIWRSGGIKAPRLAIMDRVDAPRAWLMSRVGDNGCGAAFAAVDGDVAMIHAIEVLTAFRRKGAAALLIEAAARFACDHGAKWLALAVTEANAPARGLYERLGMAVAGRYHYRVHPEGD